MKKPDTDKMSLRMEHIWLEAENRIIEDIVRRIKKAGKITSTADYQINRLVEMGKSTEEVERILKEALNATYPEMFQLYDDIAQWQYVRDKDIYEQVNQEFIPAEENEQLKQISAAVSNQTQDALKNLAQSYGYSVLMGNKRVFTPFSEYYQKYVDVAIMDLLSGAFDYNTVIRRVVTQMTNSGLRTVDYATGHTNRVPVAVRRSVLTGVSQITGHLNLYNAKKLGTNYFEVDWHAGARPTHRVWQGRVYSYEELVSVCGLGTVTGLQGANCYHDFYPFVVGASERQWSDEWLDKQNEIESRTRYWKGKELDTYGITQKQRQMETSMRAQRSKIAGLKSGGVDADEITIEKARYQAQLHEYARFCKKMGLTEERERIYYDMRGRIAPRKYIDISAQRDIIKEKKVLESKAYSSAIKAEEKKIYKDNVETAVLFDSRGNVLFRESSGASNYVKFSKEQLSRMKDATLTHNHPSSSTFSPADVSIITEQGLNVIRATGTSKTYQLKKLNGTEVNHDFSIDYEKAMSDNKKITDKDFHKYEKEYKRGKLSPLGYQEKINALNKKWNDLNSEWLKKNSKNYGYRYSVIERRK